MLEYATDRLFLRPLGPEDAELLLDYLLRNRDFLRDWEPLREEGYYSLDSAREIVAAGARANESRSGLSLGLFKKAEARLIGLVNASAIVYGAFLSCFLGYKLDEAEINRGYMTEGLKRIVELLFSEYGLHRIEANVMPRNLRSIKVLKKLGFVDEGLSEKYLRINGGWEDHRHYVLRNRALE